MLTNVYIGCCILILEIFQELLVREKVELRYHSNHLVEEALTSAEEYDLRKRTLKIITSIYISQFHNPSGLRSDIKQLHVTTNCLYKCYTFDLCGQTFYVVTEMGHI